MNNSEGLRVAIEILIVLPCCKCKRKVVSDYDSAHMAVYEWDKEGWQSVMEQDYYAALCPSCVKEKENGTR